MDKFGRKYTLLVQKNDLSMLKVELPFTVEFDIHRNSLSSANVASIRIYNLAPDNRTQIRKDQYDWGNLRIISFSAGYGDKQSLAFLGNISQAWSVREGTNMITQIESYDGGFAYANSITSNQFIAGTPNRSIIDSLVANLPGVERGAIGAYLGTIGRGNSMVGSTTDLLKEMTNEGFFIDNGKAHALKDDEYIAGDIPLINSQSGLLGTPIRENQYTNIEMLFEPGLKVGQLVQLESQTADVFNGRYKVIKLHHRGLISESVSGVATSAIGLLPEQGIFTPVSEGN